MIDWLTLSIDITQLSEATLAALYKRQSRILKINPDGQIDWCVSARESIRSDSHQLTFSFGSRLQLTGSPARVDGQNNVFGSSDIQLSALKMINWAARHLDIDLPKDMMLWKCTRIDFNRNYWLGDLASVRQALNSLRHAEGGRYQLRTSSETVYWGSNQSRISGKIYDKGSHLNHQIRKSQALASSDLIELAQGLIRLEIRIGNRFLNDCPIHWTKFSEDFLSELHNEYFKPLIGNAEVIDMQDDILEKLKLVTETEAQAKSAYSHWLQIKQIGYEGWKDLTPRRTFYRIKKILLAAGLSYSDFQARNVVPIRRKSIILGEPVKSWEELKAVANSKF